MTLLQRLAPVGLGRREEQEAAATAPALPQRRRAPPAAACSAVPEPVSEYANGAAPAPRVSTATAGRRPCA